MRQSIARGCQAYIIREGWEGLVRGNSSALTPSQSTITTPYLGPKRSVSFSAELLPTATEPLNLPKSSAQASQPHANGTYHGHGRHHKEQKPHSVNYMDPNWIAPLSDAPLSFGYGELLKDGAGEGDADEGAMVIADKEDGVGRTLKGRYIVRVGWDDVRGWMADGGTLIGSSRCPACEYRSENLCVVVIDCPCSQDPRRQTGGCSQLGQIWNRLFGSLWWRWQFDRCRCVQERVAKSDG